MSRPDPIEQAADQPLECPDLDDPGLYLNRELTWLAFNRRVLAEAEDERNPVLERVRLCGCRPQVPDGRAACST